MKKSNQDNLLSEIFTAAGLFILEGGKFPHFSGDESQIKAIHRATLASRFLYRALCNESSTLDTIAVALDEKRSASEEFERKLGTTWRF